VVSGLDDSPSSPSLAEEEGEGDDDGDALVSLSALVVA
jgi:hypothetical protein